MSLPEHENPRPERAASAPYNFVPLPEAVVKVVNGANDLPDHDRYYADRHTGHFEVTLTTKSPLYVRCPLPLSEFLRQERQEDKDEPFRSQVKNSPHFFYTRDPNQPVIPGSSLRGMLRNLLEIVSYGKVEGVTDLPKIFYRTVAAAKDDPLAEPYRKVLGRFGSNVRAGYLVKRGDDWYIKPARKPTDMGWPEKGAYLRVKETTIPAGAVPGLLLLNSPLYRPQYHPVSFNVEARKGQRGRFAAVTEIGPADVGYAHRGVLVCSGNMLETGSKENISPRRTHALVLEADTEAELVKINSQSVVDYLDALTPFQTEPPFNQYTGCLLDARPIFYIEGQDEVLFFGHSPNFRVPAISKPESRAATPLDFVPSVLRRPEEIDYADALFGYAKGNKVNGPQGSKGRAYASRVFVSDARLQNGQDNIWLSSEPIVPKILAMPKPTAFQHYLTQQEPNNKERLDHYGSPPPHEAVIRGHKLYWHQGTASSLSLDDIRRMIEEEPEVLRKIAEQEKNARPDTQHTQFKPLKPDVTFTFRVYFENLSNAELGALCWTLHPLGDPARTYGHNLGMGKPLGMGAVKLQATLHLTNRVARYASLFNGDNWQTGEMGAGEKLSDRALLEQRVRAFEQSILDELKPDKSCIHMSDLKRIGMLLKILEWPGFPPESGSLHLTHQNRPNTRYMTIQPSNEYRDRFVLPTPSAFGTLMGDAMPTVVSRESSISTSFKDTPDSPQKKKPRPNGKTGGMQRARMPKSGESARCVLLEEKTKKGGWKAKLKEAEGVGAILPGNEPPDLAPGQEVELIVQSTDPKNMSFRWPKRDK